MARPDTFTIEEIDWIKENYPTASWDEILNRINHTKTQISSKAHKLGVKRTIEFSKYTEDEDNLIREFYRNLEYAELDDKIETFVREKLPHRTISSVKNRASRLGCSVRKHWTDEEDEFLKNNYLVMTVNEMTELLDSHSRESVYNRIRLLGLVDAPMFAYTDADKKFVSEYYETMSDAEIGDVLHRAPRSIKEMRRKMGLYRKDPNETNYLSILRFIQANNSAWKKRSMDDCKYVCYITHGAFDDIHHLYSKNLILNDALNNLGLCAEDIDINTCGESIKNDILNEFLKEQDMHPLGVCLTRDLHRSFHIQYGFGNNTPEQFEEFVSNITQDIINRQYLV